MQGRSSEQLMELLLEEMHQGRKLLHFLTLFIIYRIIYKLL
jgi:hypothetical protein